jgi:hypothetical protein
MTALSTDFARATFPETAARQLSVPVAAATTLFQGALAGVAPDGSGYVTNVTATPNMRVLGVVKDRADNASGAAGAINATVERGVFAFANSSGDDAIGASDVGRVCYAVDNNTVARTSSLGARPAVGYVTRIENSLVFVEIGPSVTADGSLDLLIEAGADLSTTGQYLNVKLNGSSQVVLAGTAGEAVLGVLQNAPASGAVAIVRVQGVTQVYAGATLADGALLATAATTARAKAAVLGTVDTSDAGASGDAVVGSHIVGMAISDGTSGALMRMILRPGGVAPTTAA